MVHKNAVIFADGHMIDDMEELAGIAASRHMKLLINEDKAVLVKITDTATEDTNEADDFTAG